MVAGECCDMIEKPKCYGKEFNAESYDCRICIHNEDCKFDFDNKRVE